ncbi:hypothetical protein FRC11_001900, partial [Ceratobasidium sp. 423]
PLDGGIIASFKAQYKRRFIRFAPDQDNLGVTNMYKINQRQAMDMAADAWRAVTPQTVQNCWNHVGLIPDFTPYGARYMAPVPQVLYPPVPYQDHHRMHVPAMQVWNWQQAQHEIAQPQAYYPAVFNQLDMSLETEAIWTEQEIVDQIIAERQEIFEGNGEEEWDLEDFGHHHNPHL